MPAPRLTSSLAGHRALEVRRLAPPDGPSPTRSVVHDHAGLGLQLEGVSTFHMGVDYALSAGDVLLVPEGVAHHMVEASGACMLALAVCTACLHDAWGASLAAALDEVRRGAAAVRRLDPDAARALERTLHALAAELADERPAHDLAVDGLMSLVAVAIRRASPVAAALTRPACTPLVADALAFVEAHAAQGISLRDVAASVARAPGHVATLVKRETGRTVGEWITHARMSSARQLLARSDASIESIAERVGYASPSHFHRTFRRLHDASPDAWRDHHRTSRVGVAT